MMNLIKVIMKYEKWIDKHYPTIESAKNKCNIAIYEMTQEFDELTVQVGIANGRYHCWSIDIDGNIVDPTRKQFDSYVIQYHKIADRFLTRDEFEPATGAFFICPADNEHTIYVRDEGEFDRKFEIVEEK